MEPMPNLNVESRDMMEGRLRNPYQVLAQNIVPRVVEILDQDLIYGEKNVTLGAFVPQLYDLFRCRFVFLIRDGRDVVTSLMNWHSEGFGSIYRECKEKSLLSTVAEAALARLPVEHDTSDYSRPRPLPGDPFFQAWSDFSRFQMMSWYWAHITELHFGYLSEIPPADRITIDYSNVNPHDIERVFSFLNLEGFESTRIREMLKSRINSVWDRFRIRARFPTWQTWDESMRRDFDRIAGRTMLKLWPARDG
jgi:hypothetical protein